MALTWQHVTGPGGAAMPVLELQGESTGPTWVLTAGVHGDEYEGPEAIRMAVAELSNHTFDGAVITLPVCNPMAYAAGTRCTPADGGNLNRSFPGDAGGTLTAQWARWLWDRYIARGDCLIDLHSGGVACEFEPVAGYYQDEDAPLAAMFGLTMWVLPKTNGVLSYEFRKARGAATGAELSYGGGRDQAMAQRAALAIVELVRGQRGHVTGPCYETIEVFTSQPGEWIAQCRLGQTVAHGERLGGVLDWTGQVIESIDSPAAGRILGVRKLVSVRPRDMVVTLGVPRR